MKKPTILEIASYAADNYRCPKTQVEILALLARAEAELLQARSKTKRGAK